MKRVKFMLMSLALIAVVGGALAFKARYHVDFCSTLAAFDGTKYVCKIGSNPILTCPTPVVQKTTAAAPANIQVFCTTDRTPFNTCGDAANPLPCANQTVTIVAD